MDKEYYDALPAKMAKRAELYLVEAKKVISSELSKYEDPRYAHLIVSLAAAMMNLEAAEVIAASQDTIADKIEEHS